MTLADARSQVAAQIRTVLPDVAVFDYPPDKITPPAVILLPATPWLQRIVIGPITSMRLRLRVLVVAAPAGVVNQTALVATEDLVTRILLGAWPGAMFDQIPGPDVMTVGASDYLACELVLELGATITPDEQTL